MVIFLLSQFLRINKDSGILLPIIYFNLIKLGQFYFV